MAQKIWKPIKLAEIGAETPFFIKGSGQPETLVVKSQHGQLLDAETRRLIEWKPEQMKEADSAEAAEAEKPAAKATP